MAKEISALAPWYGSNRMLADNVGRLLTGCEWVGVPFAGGMCELTHIDARTMLVSDLHRHVINLAKVAAHPTWGPFLYRALRRVPFHPESLAEAQNRCAEIEAGADTTASELSWAVDYFVCCWMGRSGAAGTGSEFKSGIATRWNAAGGDSAVRFRNAAHGLRQWQRIMRRCTFVVQDVFDFLSNVHDKPGHGLYLDPPFPGPGDKYKHRFDEAKHRRLALTLATFTQCRILCRFYDHPLIRELYPENVWAWNYLKGRTQTNGEAPEVLLVLEGN